MLVHEGGANVVGADAACAVLQECHARSTPQGHTRKGTPCHPHPAWPMPRDTTRTWTHGIAHPAQVPHKLRTNYADDELHETTLH